MIEVDRLLLDYPGLHPAYAAFYRGILGFNPEDELRLLACQVAQINFIGVQCPVAVDVYFREQHHAAGGIHIAEGDSYAICGNIAILEAHLGGKPGTLWYFNLPAADFCPKSRSIVLGEPALYSDMAYLLGAHHQPVIERVGSPFAMAGSHLPCQLARPA